MQYEQIFEIRGNHYHNAMVASPTARDEEFLNIFREVDWSQVRSMLDYPSGGDYIGHLVPDHVLITSMDPCKVFSDASADVTMAELARLEELPPQDLVICVATLHHVEDKVDYLLQLARKLAPGGKLAVADVAAGSRVVAYLEEFVDRNTATGHRGSYMSVSDPPRLPGFSLRRAEVAPCPWRFASREELCYFGLELFGLENCSADQVFDALQSYVGISRERGVWSIDWELLYLEYEPLPGASAG